MKVYLDSNYVCHLTNDGTMREIESEYLDGLAPTVIEKTRFIPENETWVRPDGVSVFGLVKETIESIDGIENTQEQYRADLEQMSDMQNALEILGVSP